MSSRSAASPATLAETLALPGVTVGMGANTAWRTQQTGAITVPGLEAAFPAGLPTSLHVMEAARAHDAPSVAAVALAVLRHSKRRGTVVWITQGLAASEAGTPYGPGLVEHGQDPARFLFVTARRPIDALWAMEECSRSRAIAAVVGELYDQKTLDLTATRRLALRAERAEVPAFIVSQAELGDAALAARSRWQIAPAPSRAASVDDSLIGAPSFSLAITKNRDGPCPRLTVSLDTASGAFRALPKAQRLPARTANPATSRPSEGVAQNLIEPAVIRLAAERRRQFEYARMRS